MQRPPVLFRDAAAAATELVVPPLIIGHRGAAGLAPENTLEGFRRAWQHDVYAIELDVHVVAGELVVIHDATLDRTTNGQGPVNALEISQLRALDAGDGARIPLLSDVVAELPNGCGMNIELKGSDTAAPVAAFLNTHPVENLLVSSFDHAELERFRALDGHSPVAPLYSRWRVDAWETAMGLGASAINLSRRIASAARLREAESRGLASFVYTVNDVAEAQRLIDLGATGLFTDFPDRVNSGSLTDRAHASTRSPRR